MDFHLINSLPISPLRSASSPIRIVCISDTHNTQPAVPPGDILIHAGDLTEWGHFDELQTQLNWLGSQPHPHKIVIAGNHDALLDTDFFSRYPLYREDERSHKDLKWPKDVNYLCDSSIAVSVNSGSESVTQLKIYGSPYTPQSTLSAFQYPNTADFWHNKIPKDTDIVFTHGPPRLHLDKVGVRHAGCASLAREIRRLKPKLHVFGHIHVGHGREDVNLNSVRRRYADIVNEGSGDWDFEGWRILVEMGLLVVLHELARVLGLENLFGRGRSTTLVNTAVVGTPKNEFRNEAIVVEL